ncbi:hypothetical protein CRUP_014821 [Coryphaenoides rupestris]|nr:hypothetical protein CRUP_014821 [Coryphaenoides rupestris]
MFTCPGVVHLAPGGRTSFPEGPGSLLPLAGDSERQDETDGYRYFDPKMLRGSESSIPRNKNPFQEAIVFVVGGGNYIEYQNLVDYAKAKQGRKILYGCSELFNSTQFIKQLSQLGQK